MDATEEEVDRKQISSEFFLDTLRLRGTDIEDVLDKILSNIYSDSSDVLNLDISLPGRGTLLHILTQQIVDEPEHEGSLVSLFQDILKMAPRLWRNRPERLSDESKIYDYIVKRELCTLVGDPSVMDLACTTGCLPVLRVLLEKGLYVRGVIVKRGHVRPGYRYDVTKVVSGPVTNIWEYFMHVLVSYDSRYKMRSLLSRCQNDGSMDELFQIYPIKMVMACYCALTTKLYFIFAMFHILYMAVFSYASCDLMKPNQNQTQLSTKVLLYTIGLTEPILITSQLLIEVLKYTFVLLCMARDLRRDKQIENKDDNKAVNLDADQTKDSTVNPSARTAICSIDTARIEAELGILDVTRRHFPVLDQDGGPARVRREVGDVNSPSDALARRRAAKEDNTDRIYLTSVRRIVLHLPYLVLLCVVIDRVDQTNTPPEFYILSVTLFYGWILTFTLTDGIESVHFFIRVMLKIIFYNVLKIAMVYVVILIAFSLALHSQFLASPQITATYVTPFDTMFLMFDIMMGNGEIFGVEMEAHMASVGILPIFSKILYIMYLIIAPIILLNLLIAMMNTSYSALEKEHSSEWKIKATLFGLEFACAFPFLAKCLQAKAVQKIDRKMKGLVEGVWCVELTMQELKAEISDSERLVEDIIGDQLATKLNSLENRMDVILTQFQTHQHRLEKEQRRMYELQIEISEQQRKLRKKQGKMLRKIGKITYSQKTSEDRV